ncbi:hypothetical protein DFH27DRAFT_608555 [Peziza echinospora]|nr:hypothetical protein DFH27DRAFT_608555 [Peziza echinospora]
MKSNAYGSRINTTTITTASTNPALYRHSKFFQSFANLELIGFHRPGDDTGLSDSSIIEATRRLRRTSGHRSSISSTVRRSIQYNTALNSHICENTINRPSAARKRNVLIKVARSHSTAVKRTQNSNNMLLSPSRALSLRGPLFRSRRTPSADSSNSLPATMVTATTSTSGRSRRFLAKVPKLFEFEIFGFKSSNRTSNFGMPGMLSKRHRKPSTLDFRCVGMAGEDEIPQAGPTMTSIPPTINWTKPDIHSDWKKDWFTTVR